MSTEQRSMEEIRLAGLEALRQALGPVGMVRFLQQSDVGAGDYTAQRGRWLNHLSVADVADAIQTRHQADLSP
jgi:hypothetical protein